MRDDCSTSRVGSSARRRRCRGLAASVSTALIVAAFAAASSSARGNNAAGGGIITTAQAFSTAIIPAAKVFRPDKRLYAKKSTQKSRLSVKTVVALPVLQASAIDGDGGGESRNDRRIIIPKLEEVDVRHGIRTSLAYDSDLGRYVYTSDGPEGEYDDYDDDNGGEGLSHQSKSRKGKHRQKKKKSRVQRSRLLRLLSSSFLPEGVTPAYYNFMRWRIAQRYVNANVHVFGTQSLLLGLGIKNRNSLGLGAALNWVLKDALGKIVRMVWASKMGRKFDPDAKRWRFRSALLFAAGNGLEVATYVFPELFLVFATLANCCKQVSMLTSSATRNALYNSFRDGRRENIGDITAKGEAQIAVVDLLGIASGVCLSRAVGVSVRSVLTVWVLLQIVEIFCMYHEIRSVVFRMLNFERLSHVVDMFVATSSTSAAVEQGGRGGDNDMGQSVTIPTPDEMALTERVFLPPNHLSRRAIAFGSLGRTNLAPDELSELMRIFRKEKFLLVVGEDVKNNRDGRKWWRRKRRKRRDLGQAQSDAQANCHIVLHEDANNVDIVKSTLALAILRRKLAESATLEEEEDGQVGGGPARSRDCMDMIRDARNTTDEVFPLFLNVLASRGWATPARYMFGRVTMRATWPIQKGGNEKKVEAAAPTGRPLVSDAGTASSSESKRVISLQPLASSVTPKASLKGSDENQSADQ